MSFASTWPQADADAVGNGGDDLTPPPDGTYTVTLVGGGAWVAKSSQKETVRLEFELCDGSGFRWSVLLGFKSQSQANMTKKQLRELGVPVDQLVSFDQFDGCIKQLIGRWFSVTVARDGKFENTYVDGAAQPVDAQQAIAPVATAPVIPQTAPAAPVAGEDDIPF